MAIPYWSRRIRDRVFGAVFIALVILTAVGMTWLFRQGYAVHRLTRGVGDTWFLSADGRRWFRMDEHHQDVPLSDIPVHLQNAFIAVEDHRFYRHPGVDPIALGRAVVRNIRASGTVEGGSTLTQQLARTLFLSTRRSYGRKAREAALAVLIDAHLSKAQILELYLNRIYLSAGVYGVETMSRHLFGKPAKQLTLAESALVAGLAQSPGGLSPWTNLDGAVARSHVVLGRMRAQGFITAGQEETAVHARLRIRPYPGSVDARAGYAKEFLRQRFRDEFGGDHPPDWDVRTTFSQELQAIGEKAVADGLRRFRRSELHPTAQTTRGGAPDLHPTAQTTRGGGPDLHPTAQTTRGGGPGLQAALVALDPATGNMLAVVGGRDFRQSQFNRATRSRRQPGSAFKPLLYAAALDHGYSPVSVLEGLASVAPQGPEEWAPRNSDGATPDTLTLRAALLESNNRAASALQQRIGSRPVLRLASDVGLRDLPDVPSLSLGTGLVTPLGLTAAFATFPNGGLAVRPHGILRVTDADGVTVFEDAPQPERVISAQSAFQMVSMLEDVIDRGTGTAARQWGIQTAIGGKTGTTDDFKDAWFVGFSSSIVVGVWVGFDQPQTIAPDAYGSRYALPIWSDFMRQALRVRPGQDFTPADGLHDEPLCRISYLKPVEGCPTYTEYFKEGDQVPGRLCPLHQGSIKQQVRRAMEGFFKGLGKRIGQIFR